MTEHARQRPTGDLLRWRHAIVDVVVVVEIAVLMGKWLELGLIGCVAAAVAVCSDSREIEAVAAFTRHLRTCVIRGESLAMLCGNVISLA